MNPVQSSYGMVTVYCLDRSVRFCNQEPNRFCKDPLNLKDGQIVLRIFLPDTSVTNEKKQQRDDNENRNFVNKSINKWKPIQQNRERFGIKGVDIVLILLS